MPKASKQTAQSLTYPEPRVKLCIGSNALDANKAKEILGWEEQADDTAVYIREIAKLCKKKVICQNNPKNRPLYGTVLYTLMQEILRGRWQFNGEPIILGRLRSVLNGQHTLISLVIADWQVQQDPDKWPYWQGKTPTIDKAVVVGVKEEDAIINTMDTCKPRSLADVIYRTSLFAKNTEQQQRMLARMCEHAIRLLWSRLGVSTSVAFALRRTHAEALDFLARHPKLLECVQHIYNISHEKQLQPYIGPGSASALLYLMGSAGSEPSKYHHADVPSEDLLEWKLWDKACNYWVLLAGGDEAISQPVKKALAKLIEQGGGHRKQRAAILVKGWLAYCDDKPLAAKALSLQHDSEGRLLEQPSTGGIDLVEPDEIKVPVYNDPTPAEIKARAAEQRAARKRKKTGGKDTKTAPRQAAGKSKRRKTPGHYSVKDWAWVQEPDGEVWRGRIVEITGKLVRLKVAQGHQGAGTERRARLGNLHATQPARHDGS